jgi:hypothetical protein
MASKSNGQKRTVRLQLLELRTDPHQYKPFSPALVPQADKPIYVDFELPAKGVKQDTDKGVILSAVGFQSLLKEVAHTILNVRVTEKD